VLTESFEEVLVRKRNGSHFNTSYTRKGFTSSEYDGKHLLNAPSAFIKLDGKSELSYSHSAEVYVDDEGYLSTFYKDGNESLYPTKGNRVYGQNGYIQVGDAAVSFDDLGNVLLDGEIADNILFVPTKDVIGTMGSGIRVERTETLFEQGQLERTDIPLDIAIDGKGFFEIESDLGTLYTRDGRFKINQFNELVTSEGFKVVGLNGTIDTTGDNLQINHFGEVIIDGVTTDKINVVNIGNTYDLEKYGAGYYKMEDNFDVVENDPVAEIRQGYIEKSNAENLNEMITLMELYRNYESNQRMVTAYDSTLDKAVNQIGRL
jgi:flagellar basal-body rod protein FlgG